MNLFNRYTTSLLNWVKPSRLAPSLVLFLTGAFSFILLGGATQSSTTALPPIVLVPEKLPFVPTEFYIADVVDARPNTKAVAFLLPTTASPALQEAKPQAVDLEGGAAVAIKKYLTFGLAANTKLRPVVMRLKQMKVTEKPDGKGRIAGKADLVVSFEVKREGKLLHLFDYKGGASYTRGITQKISVEPTLRQSLAQSVQYLHLWMQKEAPHNEKLAREIKVYFEDFTQNTEPDTLFYDSSRPLNWSDFKGAHTRPGSYVASIFPGFSSDSYAVVQDGVVHIKVTLRVYALRHLSKVKDDAKDAYTLNHEQRHFDIAKLVAEHYKQRVQPHKLTLEDYDSMIKYEYLEALWEMDKLQEQYDQETGHGINRSAQEGWNRKIDSELRALKIKP